MRHLHDDEAFMMHSTSQAQQAQRALLGELTTLRLGQSHETLWSQHLALLGAALNAPMALTYDYEVSGSNALHVGRLVCTRAIPGARALINHSLERRGSYGLYHPVHPAPWQQNRALNLEQLTSNTEAEKVRAGWHRWGLGRSTQLRTLVCHDGVLLAWVGVFRSDEEIFTSAERARLQALTGALRRRLTWEHRAKATGLDHASLEACLEALGTSAGIVDSKQQVVFANALLREELRVDRWGVRQRVDEALAGAANGLEVTPLSLPGPAHHLIVNPHTTRPSVGAAAKRFGLTRREQQVLQAIVEGRPNRAIATRLGCAERTVEAHVSHLLEKMGATSRAQLAADLLRST